MIRKFTSLTATAVFLTGAAFAGAAQAATEFDTICQASGPDRAELSRSAKAFFVGVPLDKVKEVFGADWGVVGPIKFDTFYDAAGNPHPNNGKVLHMAAYKDCASGSNSTQFFVMFEAADQVIDNVSVEINYEDEDFLARHETLDWRRYNSNPSLIKAVRSVLGDSADKSEVETTLTSAGMIEPGACSGIAEDMAVFESPAYPEDSMAHKLGTNAQEDGRLSVAARFDAQGEMIEILPADGMCQTS